MDWFRSYVGTTTDPKFRVVAKKSGARLGDVLSIWQMVLERACASAERGRVDGFDCEGADTLLDLKDGSACKIFAAMESKGLIVSGKVAAWEKRQPKRERDDDSSQRVKEFRERKKQESNASCDNVTPCNAKQRQETPRGEENRGEEETPSLRSGVGAVQLEVGPAPLAPVTQPEVFVLIPVNGDKDHAVTMADLEEYKALYGNVDVELHLRKMRGYWASKPKNQRKTTRGIKTSINTWLAKEQDRARSAPPRASPAFPMTPRQQQTERFKGMAIALKNREANGNGGNHAGGCGSDVDAVLPVLPGPGCERGNHGDTR